MEKKFGFNLKKSIDLASKNPLLSNYKIYATKSCQPSPKEIKGKIKLINSNCRKYTGLNAITLYHMPKFSSYIAF